MRLSLGRAALPRLLAVLSLAILHSFAQDESSPQLQLFSPDAFQSLSDGCAAALTANLSCALMETGNSLYQLTSNLTTAFLDTLCTDECKESIQSYRENVLQACATDVYDDRANSTTEQKSSSGVYMPIVLPDCYFTNYNQRCLKDRYGYMDTI